MKQLKILALLVGMIPVLIFAILAAILAMMGGFVLALALQVVWSCVPLASTIVGGILLGIASAVTGREPSLTEKQQTIARWFVGWPLLVEMHLIVRLDQLLVKKLASIPGIQFVES